MLKLHPLILLCILATYAPFILKEENFDHTYYNKNESVKQRDTQDRESRGRLLGEDNNEFFDIGKLKKLLYFQSNLDQTIKQKRREEKKLRKLYKAAKSGNFAAAIRNSQKDTQQNGAPPVENEHNTKGKSDMNDGGEMNQHEVLQRKEDNPVDMNQQTYGEEQMKNETGRRTGEMQEEIHPLDTKVNGPTEKFINKHDHVDNTRNVEKEKKEENVKHSDNAQLRNILQSVEFLKKTQSLKNYFGSSESQSRSSDVPPGDQNKYADELKIQNENEQVTQLSGETNYGTNNVEGNFQQEYPMSKNNEEKKNNYTEEPFYMFPKNDEAEKFNTHLRRSKIKEFFEVNDLVKYMKNLLGIKSNIHEKFEHEKLIVKNCNYESFGPEFCSVDEEAKKMLWNYENKKNCAFLFIILFTLFFSLLIQNIVYYIEKRVRNSKDQFRKDLLNTAFRQISLITIINLTIWGILQSNVAEALDEIIFNDILPQQRNVDEVLHNVEPLLETIFEKILFISMNFLICYSLFIINIHFVTRRILKWFSEADNCDISNIAKELKEARKGCFRNLFFFLRYSRNSKYLAHRYDFSENVDAISIPGLDPNGYYYYEYMRACLLKYNVKLIKIPNAVILFLVFACISLRPFFNIRLKAEVIFLNFLSLICIMGLLLMLFYLYKIDRKLLPRDIGKYLLNRYHIETCEQSKKDITPYYKLLKQQVRMENVHHTILTEKHIDVHIFNDSHLIVIYFSIMSLFFFFFFFFFSNFQSVYPSAINYFLYKTTFPNKHEQLFYFWGNGPRLINFIFQTLCFCFLIILSCWIFLLRVDNITWFQLYSYGSLAICVCIFLFLIILKYIIYYNIMISKTGYLIDTKLLEKVSELAGGVCSVDPSWTQYAREQPHDKFFLGPPSPQVWEFERSDNIKRISEFIDAIKIKSTLHALKEGGEVFWRQLLIKSNTVPSNIQEKMFSIWVGLDEENRGVIDSAKILKFLKSQGINLTSESDIKEFLEVFDRNKKNGLNQEEFFVLIIIVKQILVELLDINAVQSLFEEVYGIPWNSLSSIDANSLKRILTELNLQWPHGKIRNLIDFVCENKKTKYVSAEYFIKQLINIEEVTLQPFHSSSDTK
ncbi:conserved Plasmodium membrane protein, unknown function [Plasmodium knowlesi strain H]|uniref:EF-hand domain-containing protein n=1 Tax=Plasmodium knowlesi (strain H) TaxID=5851 RepID=A0A1A7VU54_PLAKH|nr:conserved Plasmodium membrane protein, unknown function [Plasmodium knowlesi strain H]